MDTLNTKSLFKKVVSIIMLTTFICVTFIISSWFYLQQNYIKETNETHSHQIINAIDFRLNNTLEDAKSNILDLINSDVFLEKLKQRDREGLHEMLKQNFKVMQKEDAFLNLLQINLKEEASFVSLQESELPDKHTDTKRVMLQEVHTLHHEVYGYVKEANQISYRIIVPIFDTHKKYLGAMEIGWSSDFILDMIRKISGFEGLVFIQNREMPLSDISQNFSIDGYQLYSKPTQKNINIFKALDSYGHFKDGAKIEYNKERYTLHFVNLKNYSNQIVLRVVFLDNKSEHNLFSSSFLVLLVTLFILTFALLLPLIYRVINRYQKSVIELFQIKIDEMNSVKDELKFNRKYFKNIFDAVPNIIVITDGHTMVNANPAMLDFLHYESFEAFKLEHNCICDLFLGGSGYLQPDKDGVSWIEQIKADPLAHHEVLISRDGVQHIFNIRLKSFKLDKNPMYIIVLTDITELEESRAQFELAINGTNDGLWDWNIESNQLFFSKKWKAMLGYSEDEIGNDFSEWSSRTHPDDLKFVNDAIRISHKNDAPYKTTFRMKHKDGHWVWILERGECIFDDNGKLVRMIGFHTDISAEKKLEKELQDAKKQFEEFIEHFPAIVIIKDENRRVIYANQIANRFFHQDTIVGKVLEDYLPTDTVAHIKKMDDKILQDGVFEDKIEFVNEKNERMFYRNLGFKIVYDNRVSLGIISINITKEYLAHQDVEKLKSALERSPMSVVITDKNGTIEYVNPNYTKITGYSKEELINQNPRLVKSGETSQEQYAKMWAEISSGNIWQSDVKNIAKDGSFFWEDSTIVPSFDPEGRVDGYIAFKLDITEKIRLRDKLNAERDKNIELGLILQEVSNEIYIYDKKSLKFIYANKSACENVGYTLEELKEITPYELRESKDKEIFTEYLKEVDAGKRSDRTFFSSEQKRKDNTTYNVDMSIQKVIFNGKEAYMSFIIDTTFRELIKQKMLNQEEIMITQSRHAAMGEMIGMIAHQWRQPITIIAMEANNLLVDIQLEELNEESVREQSLGILKQTEYLSKTIDDFRNFFRPNKTKEETDIYSVMQEAEGVMGKSLLNSQIKLVISKAELPTVLTYSRELLQVYLNLLKNAKEALVEHRENERKIEVSFSSNGTMLITSVCDNGGGIQKEIMPKIFEPYFSTKDAQTGTGLGLYMSKTIIEKHLKGRIEVNNVQDGVCFAIYIPMDKKIQNERYLK